MCVCVCAIQFKCESVRHLFFSLCEFSKQQHLQVKAGWRPGAAACLLCPVNLLWL